MSTAPRKNPFPNKTDPENRASYRHPRSWALGTHVLLVQAVVVATTVLVGLASSYLQATGDAHRTATVRTLGIARIIATSPEVHAALGENDPSPRIQDLAERWRAATGCDFIVVMTPEGRRLSHPDTTRIGKEYLGHRDEALAGRSFTEEYTGTLGASLRSIVPIRADSTSDGPVVALVSVGIAKVSVADDIRHELPTILGGALLIATLGGAGSHLIAHRVRRETHGMSSRQLRELYEYYDAVLHAVREGVILVHTDGTLRIANDEAVRLLGLTEDAVGTPVDALGLDVDLTEALTGARPCTDTVFTAMGRPVVVNAAAAHHQGEALGIVATLRDRTQLEMLTGELDSTRSLRDALHAQAHESANRLHTVVSLVELGRSEEAVRFALGELATTELLSHALVGTLEEPALRALILSKTAEAAERGVELTVEETTHLAAGLLPARDLVTVAGNLIDNAIDAACPGPGRAEDDRGHVTFAAWVEDGCCVIEVADDGPGIPTADVSKVFRRGWSTKEPRDGEFPAAGRGLGLALVGDVVARWSGRVEVGDPPGAVVTVHLPVVSSGQDDEADVMAREVAG
ncbi:two-component system, CitB family, sensor kinase [Austwickia chelonae]|uniref:histidine kinase n=1 Tax=Austwickia chelonae NBRC 105200 TaxID=1184607 RepID=K6WCA2_9MICO|nr:sensor histidine kinase [Austwickia chelonae]GAB79477.1 putative two-component histidine kinase [Austwickia chelonae NBRC 105200]SEW38508.1 two-component system, CitB family, sensor kinase [Austwickia chelonae]